jgi:hypothetical protein
MSWSRAMGIGELSMSVEMHPNIAPAGTGGQIPLPEKLETLQPAGS